MIDASVLKKISDHYFGWHTHQFSRWWEYPWVISQIELSDDLKILDAGSGKSPLPFFLTEKGAVTYTVDNGSPDESAEWGYVDYSAFNHQIVSYNMNFRSLPWAKDDYFDAIISVSVMEHLPAHERREAFREFNRILKDNGRLILTIDVQKDGIKLWNRCRGIKIEADEVHGTVESLIEELNNYGFTVFTFEECPVKNDETLVIGLALIKSPRLSGTYAREEPEAGKGHVKQKYTNDYFLGTNNSRHFAVHGWDEFQKGKTNDRVKSEFEFLLQVAGSLQDKDVLEIGFGRGDFIPLFLNAGIRTYVGMDFSPSAIQIASDNFKDPRLNLFQMNATDLSVDKKFDIVALFDIIEHIPPYDMEIVWSKIKQILKPGGYIAISTPIFENPNSADHSDLIEEVSGMHCNKQTIGTLFFSSLKNGFTIAKHNDRTFVLIQSNDLNLLPEEVRDAYVQNQSSLLNRFGLRNVDQNEPNQLTRKLVPGAGRIAVGCVTENQPKYLSQALRLLQSIRWFGGDMSGVNFFVCFVDEINSEYEREFERLGAFVRKVRRFSKDHPHSNKLSFFDLPEIAAYDTIMLLDCDTIIVQDPLRFLDGSSLQAKIVDLPTVPNEVFFTLFKHFNLPLPPQTYQCTSDGSPTIWYCNAGVLVFPSELVKSFVPIWRDYNRKLISNLDLLAPNQFYCDQASLSLAFAANPVSFTELPVSMNFPLHLTNLKTPPDMMQCDPIILHYHDKVDASGYLLPSPHPGAQRRIQLFNDRLRESRKVHFDNRLFWDFRYSNFPELGSGIGSRGESLAYKRELLKRIINGLEPSSILDIGCGDCEVSSEIPANFYTGVDISKVVIDNNISKMPSHKFIHGNFLTLDLEPADLILCFDVLIHLSNPRVYQAFVQKLISCSLKYGVISGYEERPSDGAGMCFFHEPLSLTLKRFGAHAIRKVGQYRNVTVYSYIKSPSEPILIEDFEPDLTSVCITGMHRSGTSMVSRLLNLCGLYLGEEKDILSPQPDNPEGFWENVHFVNLNDEILSKLGGAWDLPPHPTKGWERQPRFKTLAKKASLLIQGFEQQSFWGWKDPRSSLTAPFWNMLIKNLKFVICVRHPLEVAGSLRKRGYNSNAFSLNLWHVYNQQLLAYTKQTQRIVTHYDSYFKDPKGELRRIFDFLNIEISEEAIDRACATIKTSLRHHRTQPEKLPLKTQKLYDKLCANAGSIYQKSIHTPPTVRDMEEKSKSVATTGPVLTQEMTGTHKTLKPNKIASSSREKEVIQAYPRKIDGPIVVYNMGKVGSRSIYETLVDLNIGVPIYHAHVLHNLEKMGDAIKKQFPNPVNSLLVIEQGQELRRLIDSNHSRHWNLITPVRDPVARNVSRFFHSIEEVIPDIRRQLAAGLISVDDLFDVYLKKWEHQSAINWFNWQFKPVFNIDVYSQPFPIKKGFDILQEGRFSVLLIRLENLDSCAEQALHDFLGLTGLKLKRSNTGAEKWYKGIYQEFIAKVKLPDQYLDDMYNSQFARHFYSPGEIKTFRAKWSQQHLQP